MTVTDILLIAALAAFVIAWWSRRLPARRIALAASAVAAIVVAAAGFLGDRWQDGVGGAVAVVFLGMVGVALLRDRKAKKARADEIPWVYGAFVTLMAAGAAVSILMFPVWPLPKPSGEYTVGVRTFELVDANRLGVLGAKPDEPRRLLVRVWYPAGDVSGRSRAPYFTDAEAKSTARSLGALVGAPFFFTYSRHVMTNAFVDAPLAPGVTNLPTAFYSHGYTSFLGQNTVLMEHLASHGYVVFSVQHTYDSAATAFPNGDVIPMDPGMMSTVAGAEAGRQLMVAAMGGATLDARLEGAIAHQEFTVKRNERIATASTRAWVADRMFVHDTLQKAPPASVADIAAASRLDRVGELGMSFGGAVSGEVCMVDARCAAGINLDGSNYPFSAFNADVPAPFLMFHSDLTNIYRQLETRVPEGSPPRGYNEFSYERLAGAGTRPDVYRVQLKGAQHLGLSDSSLFLTSPLRDPLFGTTPTNILINAQNDFVLGFLDKHMRNAANGFPAKEMASYKDWMLPASNADIRDWWNAKPEAERAAFEARIAAVKQRYEPQALVEP